MKLDLVVVAAALTAIACGGCARCGEEGAPAAPAKAGLESDERAAAPVKEKRRPAKPAPAPEFVMPQATGPVGPLPDALRGAWEKTEQPFGGMRIEFAEATGMAEVRVATPPADDAAAAAFYAQKKSGVDAEHGAETAACIAKIWGAGAIKYKGIKPTARADEWVGSVEMPMIHIPSCSRIQTKEENVVLRLKSQDELVATGFDSRIKQVKTESWKRVVP